MDNSFDSLLNASAVPQDEKVQAFIAESKNNKEYAAMSCQSR